MLRRTLSYLLIFFLLAGMISTPTASASSNAILGKSGTSENLYTTSDATVKKVATQVALHADGSGYKSLSFLTDGNIMYYYTSKGDCSINLKSDTKFCSLYILFDFEPEPYTITDSLTGDSITAGHNSFLHEYVALPFSATEVTITFSSEVSLSEISAYTSGTPEGIQIWESPLDGETDLLLLATHGDDDHLFFAGLLPLYAGELGYNVQVAYWTSHRPHTTKRTHEMLNGLWDVGVTNYPIFGPFDDFRQDTLATTYWVYNYRGITNEELLSYVVTLVRRFDPQVVVCHDINGEYGHGMHMLYTDLMIKALDITAEPSAYPEIAAEYGVWDVPKTYIHLYEENPIVIDYDQPLDFFNGMTAFEVSQKIGFPRHVSQQKERMFTNWLYGYHNEITKATQIKQYSPCQFGLYRSTVGKDKSKDDFMENITSYEQQRVIKEAQLQAEAERLEKERLEAEQQEAARQEAEHQAKLEAELAQEESIRTAEESAMRQQTFAIIVIITLILSACGILLSILIKKRK